MSSIAASVVGGPGASSPGKILKCIESRKCHFPRFKDEIIPFFNAFLQVRTNRFHMIRKIARLLSRNARLVNVSGGGGRALKSDLKSIVIILHAGFKG